MKQEECSDFAYLVDMDITWLQMSVYCCERYHTTDILHGI